jgi:hypothetical protein
MGRSIDLSSLIAGCGMEPRRWQRIEEIFHQATELPPGERTAFVVEACEEDESLVQEVLSLLAFHSEEDQETLLNEMRLLVQEQCARLQAEQENRGSTENS